MNTLNGLILLSYEFIYFISKLKYNTLILKYLKINVSKFQKCANIHTLFYSFGTKF